MRLFIKIYCTETTASISGVSDNRGKNPLTIATIGRSGNMERKNKNTVHVDGCQGLRNVFLMADLCRTTEVLHLLYLNQNTYLDTYQVTGWDLDDKILKKEKVDWLKEHEDHFSTAEFQECWLEMSVANKVVDLIAVCQDPSFIVALSVSSIRLVLNPTSP